MAETPAPGDTRRALVGFKRSILNLARSLKLDRLIKIPADAILMDSQCTTAVATPVKKPHSERMTRRLFERPPTKLRKTTG